MSTEPHQLQIIVEQDTETCHCLSQHLESPLTLALRHLQGQHEKETRLLEFVKLLTKRQLDAECTRGSRCRVARAPARGLTTAGNMGPGLPSIGDLGGPLPEEFSRIIPAANSTLRIKTSDYNHCSHFLGRPVLVPRPEVSLIDRFGFQSGRADFGAGLRTRAVQMLTPVFWGRSLISLFSLLSLTVNLLAIVILSRGKCGLSTCTTRYLVAMAMADLPVIITEVILFQINYYYFPVSFLDITPVCSVIHALIRAATDCSVWFTVTFTFDRFVAICCQKLKTKYCTKKTAAVVLATTCILLCSKNIPIYFRYEPGVIIDNVPWFCYIKQSYYTEPGWVGFSRFDTVLTPLIPFALILLLNALTVRHILVTSRVRKGLRGQSKGENRSDPEMESRRKSVILLFTISGNFILLWLIYVLYHFGIVYHFDSDSNYIFKEVGWMMSNLNCCTNTFIYVVTQSKFRDQVKSAVKYPVTSIIQLM
ncbi:probable G-protein coupled receptor 139, partial [Heterodontus francisci]|uniref:probable G-protein coupled receptor 139 n=1 Tax=Heterodontus francisci TaxID=7792 RepID=UPI00355BC071